MGLTDEQLREFGERGYLVIPSVVDEPLLAAADAEIDALIAAEPPPPDTVGKHFWFLPPAQLPAALAALDDSGARSIAEELTAPHPLALILDHIQIASEHPAVRASARRTAHRRARAATPRAASAQLIHPARRHLPQ